MKEATHQKLLVATRKLIWKQGVNKTSVDQICDEAGLSKMTFYRAYENKFDIIKEILDENYKDMEIAYENIFTKNIPFIEKVMELIYYNMEATKEISPDLIRDIIKQDNPQMKDYMRSKVDYYRDLSLKYIIIEQKKGNFRDDVKIEFIAFFLDHINELLLDERLNEVYESTDELANQLTKMFYFGILRRN
ncbi:MAG: TetR/AcrR family transcriptional regulator [Candidatus Kapaibacterium sp.]